MLIWDSTMLREGDDHVQLLSTCHLFVKGRHAWMGGLDNSHSQFSGLEGAAPSLWLSHALLLVWSQISACSVAADIASSGVPLSLISGWMDQTANSAIHAFYHAAKAPGALTLTTVPGQDPDACAT